MHGPFITPSGYSSAFELPASMIHPCWTATTMLWCPGTHSGPHAHCPTAYPCVQAHSQCIAVAPYAFHTIPMNPGPGRHISAPPGSSMFGLPCLQRVRNAPSVHVLTPPHSRLHRCAPNAAGSWFQQDTPPIYPPPSQNMPPLTRPESPPSLLAPSLMHDE